MILTLENIAKKYIDFEIGGKTLSIPYMINDGSRYCSPKTQGKGSLLEITNELLKKASEEGVNLDVLDEKEIRDLMKKWGIGIDCSGIVSQILEEYLFHNFQTHLVSHIQIGNGIIGKIRKLLPFMNKISQINANILLSPTNSYPVELIKDIREGDLISLTHPNWPTKHVVLIIKVTKNYIFYINSSDNYTDKKGNHLGYTQKDGAHIEKIKIIHPEKPLEKQLWFEKTYLNETYGRKCFKVKKGDSVRRLKFFDSIRK